MKLEEDCWMQIDSARSGSDNDHMLSNTPNVSSSQQTHRSALIESFRTNGARRFHQRRHLLDTGDLSQEEVASIIETARLFKTFLAHDKSPLDLLKAKVVATLFYENSTRTRSSFDLSAQNLGARVLNLDVPSSSATKGETIGDTATTLSSMGVDALIQRHSNSGAAHQLLSCIPAHVSVVNAGDGWNAHPTQALLDLLTMLEVCGDLAGKKIVIVGDIKHSRVARSNIRLLVPQGANVHLCGPPTLIPDGIERMGVTTHYDLAPALDNADFVMALRMQTERQQDGLITSIDDYRKLWRIDHACLKNASPKVRLLHPGPINRGVELTSELVDDQRISLVRTQVANGIPIRMSVLFLLLFSEETSA